MGPTNRCLTILTALVVAAFGATSAIAEPHGCPAVVIGENDPASDVDSVQHAVDNCRHVFLQGTFNFTGMETGDPLSVVKISRPVNIVGVLDDRDQTPTIVGGQTPLSIDAPGAAVRITGLSFVSSVFRAILVTSADSVSIASCTVEGTVPIPFGALSLALGIGVGTDSPGVVNRLTIVHNHIADPEAAVEIPILVAPVDGSIGKARICRNELRAKAHGIDLRDMGGSAQIDRNRITVVDSPRSGDAGPPQRLVDGIRCQGVGAHSVHWNRIETLHPNSAGVRLEGATGAIVENNDIRMTPPAGTVPGTQSAGVQVTVDSSLNLVRRNTISGEARTALSVVGPLPDVPEDNKLVRNRHEGFVPSFVDVEIGEGALRTLIVNEEGTISDLGTGTIVK